MANLAIQTQHKFTAVCMSCESDNVSFGVSYGTADDGWGGRMSFTRLSFKCNECENTWAEDY